MTTPSSPWILDADPPDTESVDSDPVDTGPVDADPVETAGAVAKAMQRLARETTGMTTLDQAPQIAEELRAVLREMATITTHLASLAFEHPTPPPPDGDLPAFTRRTPATRAADGFNDATNLIYLACQPLAGAQNETTRLTSTTATHHTPPGRTPLDPGPGHSRRGQAAREESTLPPSR